MNAEVTLPRHGDRRGKCKPLQQHLQHHHANSQKSEHTAAIFNPRQHLDTTDRVTRLSGRADGKLPPRMRMMKSPSFFSIERQRRPRDAAVLGTAGKLSQASATIRGWSTIPIPVWLPISQHWHNQLGNVPGREQGISLLGIAACRLCEQTCLSNMVSSHRWQQKVLIHHTGDL